MYLQINRSPSHHILGSIKSVQFQTSEMVFDSKSHKRSCLGGIIWWTHLGGQNYPKHNMITYNFLGNVAIYCLYLSICLILRVYTVAPKTVVKYGKRHT